MVDMACVGCGVIFAAKTRRARWHSPACKTRTQRHGVTAVPNAVDLPEPTTGLVASVRRELEAASAVETFAGQLALQLAKRLSTPEESGISSLSKELRTVMAAALEGHVPPAAEEQPEDEVEKARRARDAKARKAAG